MPFNMTIELNNNQDTFTRLAEVLSEDCVNIDGGCGFLENGNHFIHMLVDDPVPARLELEEAGFHIVDCRPVLVLGIKGLPNRLGEIIAALYDAEIPVDFFYLNSKNQLVLGVGEVNESVYAILNKIIKVK